MSERKNIDLHIRATKEQMDWLDVISDEAGMTKSEYVRRALQVYCNIWQYAPEIIRDYEKERAIRIG